MTDKEDFNIDDLRWVRVFTPIHIPKQLIEQVRDRDYSVEDFYKYHEINCVREGLEGITLNPLSHLYILADKENMIRGFLWFTIDVLSKDICIHTYSIEKTYWQPGKAIKKVVELIKDIKNKANLNKVYWVTRYPAHTERYGFKKSTSILMEYSEKEEQLQEEKGA